MFILRPDQQDVYEQIQAAIVTHKPTIVSASTGFGKSVVMGTLANDLCKQGKSVLTLVHRDNLIKQLADTYSQVGISNLGYIKAGKPRNYTAKCVLGSTQTLDSRGLDFTPDVIILDECHITSHAKSTRKAIADCPNATVLGFTATPMPSNKKRSLKPYYTHEIIAPTPRKLMEMGNLARDIYFVEQTGSGITESDIKGLGVNSFGEYNTRDLIRLMDKPGFLEIIVDYWLRHSKNRLTIAFTASVEFAYRLAEVFNKLGYPAVAVDGSLSTKERDRIYTQFENREYLLLINCQVLIEGFDVKAVETVMLLSPDRSKARYIQKVGRGLRPYPGKTSCFILDLGLNLDRHGAISDLLREDYLLEPPKTTSGVAPTKVCTNCEATVHASLMVCPNCGHKFPEKKLEVVPMSEEMERFNPHNFVPFSENEREMFYKTKRALSFRKKYKPTYAYGSYYAEFETKPEWKWNLRQLTKDENGCDVNLARFFSWIADWAFKYYDGEEVYKKFKMQVGMEFGVHDPKSLPTHIKEVARECYRKAQANAVHT